MLLRPYTRSKKIISIVTMWISSIHTEIKESSLTWSNGVGITERGKLILIAGRDNLSFNKLTLCKIVNSTRSHYFHNLMLIYISKPVMKLICGAVLQIIVFRQ